MGFSLRGIVLKASQNSRDLRNLRGRFLRPLLHAGSFATPTEIHTVTLMPGLES